MHKPGKQRPFPLYPLLGAGTLVLVSLLSVAWIRWFGEPGQAGLSVDPVVIVRELRFADLADGSVQVTDAASGQEIQRIAAGGHGFVRATLRGLARARRARGVGQTVPFRLELRESGQLLLLDPATGQAIDLWAFGATNAEAFASMLGADSQPLASLALTAAPSRP